MDRFPASKFISLSPLLPQRSTSQRNLSQLHPSTSSPHVFPNELKSLIRYAQRKHPSVQTSAEFRSWLEDQLHTNAIMVEAFFNTPEAAFQTSNESPHSPVSPRRNSWRTPERNRRLKIVQDDDAEIRVGRASSRLQLTNNKCRVDKSKQRRPSVLGQFDLLPTAAVELQEEGQGEVKPLPFASANPDPVATSEVCVPPVLSEDLLAVNASQSFGVRLMDRLAWNKASHGDASVPKLKGLAPKDNPIYYSENMAKLTTIEVRNLLREERFSTPDQHSSDTFIFVSRYLRAAANLLSLLMIFFSAFSIAARVGITSDHVPPQLCWVELGLDAMTFLVVLAVNMFVPYEDGGHVVFDAMSIAKRYLSHPRLFLFDLVSNFPVLVILAPMGLQNFEFARVNLLLRGVKLSRVLATLEEMFLPPTMHPSPVRLGKYSLYLILMITHLSTAFMLVLRSESSSSVAAWMNMDLDSISHDPVYWCLRCWREMLSSIAEKRVQYPHEDIEYAASLILLVFALASIAIILASYEEIIVTEINTGNLLTSKIEATISALEHRGLPGVFQEEVAEYYERMWEINRTFDFEIVEDVLAELPEGLHADIEFECNAKIIRTIPLFSEVAKNPRFVGLLVGQLRQIVVMPGASIVLKGEDGDCMFFVSSGDAAVMNQDGDKEVFTLGVGAFFGEVTMLFGGTRDRDILAKTVCVCAVITAKQFESVLQEYPEALEGILKVAVERAQQKIAGFNPEALVTNNFAPVVEQRPSPDQQNRVFDDPFANVNSTAKQSPKEVIADDRFTTQIANGSFLDDGTARNHSLTIRDALLQRLRSANDVLRVRPQDGPQEAVAGVDRFPKEFGELVSVAPLKILALLEEACLAMTPTPAAATFAM